jgi:hypothetical protein
MFPETAYSGLRLILRLVSFVQPAGRVFNSHKMVDFSTLRFLQRL